VFKVELGATSTISGLTISGGGGVQYGGGVWNRGKLKLSEVVVTNNSSTVGGGGVHSDGLSLEIVDSTVSHNRSGWGGGVRGDLEGHEWIRIERSTIAYNVADDGSPATTNGAGTLQSRSRDAIYPEFHHRGKLCGRRRIECFRASHV
jgi:predicted outer membrane repeat protein